MKRTKRTGTRGRRWGLPSILILVVLAIVGAAFLSARLQNDGESTHLETADSAAPELEMPRPGMSQGGKPDEDGEPGYERITDEEYKRRAAESPDQTSVGQRFEPQQDKDKGKGKDKDKDKTPGDLD